MALAERPRLDEAPYGSTLVFGWHGVMSIHLNRSSANCSVASLASASGLYPRPQARTHHPELSREALDGALRPLMMIAVLTMGFAQNRPQSGG